MEDGFEWGSRLLGNSSPCVLINIPAEAFSPRLRTALFLGLGIKNYMVTDKTGPVVGIKVVDGTEDLLLVTQAGILIRTPVDSIRTAGRATQGVIVMRFKEEGDHVISLALTDHEEGSAEAEE